MNSTGSLDNLNTILKELECPVCLNYMHTVIPMCIKGHSICQHCREKCKTCPNCRSGIENNRNYSLEAIASALITACSYEGCGVLTTVKNLKEHEDSCEYGFSCPLQIMGCRWKGKHSFITYHLNTHNAEELTRWHPDSKCNVFMKLCFHKNNLFILCTKFCSSTQCKIWSAQYVGPKENAKNYLLKIDFKDTSNQGYQLTATQPCIPLCNIEDAFKSNKITIPFDMMQYFKSPDTNSAKFKITLEDKNVHNSVP